MARTYQQYLAAKELKKLARLGSPFDVTRPPIISSVTRAIPCNSASKTHASQLLSSDFAQVEVPYEVPHLVPAARGAQADGTRLRARHLHLLRLRMPMGTAPEAGLHLRVRVAPRLKSALLKG